MTDPASMLLHRLRSSAAGLLAVLNALSLAEAGKDFPHLLVENPLEAYRVVLRYTRGDRRKARYLLTSILIGIIGSPLETEKVVEALERGDPRPLQEILRRFAGAQG